MNFLSKHLNFEVKIFLVYILVGGLWILFSDKLVGLMVTNPELITRLQTFKGWFYVLITGVLFFLFLRRHLRKLRLAEQRARESDRLKTTFLQNISHEIRTPMNGIMGFTEILKKENLSDKERDEFLTIISDSSSLLFNLVNDVLDISMIESGTTVLTFSNVSLNSIMDELYDYYNHLLRKDVSLRVIKGFENGSDIVYTDAMRLRQILRNLISNAMKFVDAGYIKFGYRPTGDHIEFFVEDTGIGISEYAKEHIFDRFFKDNTQKDRIYDGVGLGLAISKGLVELLEGRIWIESEQGKGSVFYFTIPDRKQSGQLKSPEEQKTGITGNKKKFSGLKILVAEDDIPNQRLMSEILRRQGIQILLAGNGRQAIELFQANSDIDIVFMDIKMPVMDGYEALAEIRKLKPDAYVVAQTAYSLNEESRSIAAGFNDYITKPFREKDFVAILERRLEHN